MYDKQQLINFFFYYRQAILLLSKVTPSLSCKHQARMLHLQTNLLFKEKILNSLHQLLIFALTPQQEKLAPAIIQWYHHQKKRIQFPSLSRGFWSCYSVYLTSRQRIFDNSLANVHPGVNADPVLSKFIKKTVSEFALSSQRTSSYTSDDERTIHIEMFVTKLKTKLLCRKVFFRLFRIQILNLKRETGMRKLPNL